MSFVVDHILNAQLYNTEEDDRYWVFLVKWFRNGRYTTTMENESHPVFRQNPSILRHFWDSHNINPDTYTATSLILATKTYINETKANQAELLFPRKRGRERTASPSSGGKRRRSINTNNDTNADNGNIDIPETPIETLENSPTIITLIRPSEEPIQIDSDSDSDVFEDQQTLSLEQLSLSNGDRHSSLGFPNKDITPAWSLPPIATINDLPDFEDSDIVETIPLQTVETNVVVNGNTSLAEAPSTENGTSTSFSSSSETDRREVDDILTVTSVTEEPEPEPEPEPESQPEIISISSGSPRSHVIDDDNLYADASYVPDPSTFVPMSTAYNDNDVETPPLSQTQTRPQRPKLQLGSPISISSPPVSPTRLTGRVRSATRSLSQTSWPFPTMSPKSKPSSPVTDRVQKRTSPPISNSRPIPNPSASPVLNSETKDQSIPKRDYPGFTLRLENDSRLPVYIKDDRDRIFRDFVTAIDDEHLLSVHGYYLHNDITKFFENNNYLKSNKTRGFAKIFLEARSSVELKDTWTSLSNDLATKSLCLVLFVPDEDEALFVFSSQSKTFGRSVGAPTWAIGIRDRGLVLARVALHHSDLCFRRQYR